MSEVEDLLERIERRAEALVRENARLRDKIVDLDRKGEEMQKAIKDKDILINNLTEQNKILKLQKKIKIHTKCLLFQKCLIENYLHYLKVGFCMVGFMIFNDLGSPYL